KELHELQCFAEEDLPSPKKWSPYIALHKKSVHCIPEIRQGLSKQSAEEWAEASNHFSGVLLRKGLLLQEGIAAVAKWLLDLRRFLEAMGVTTLVPHPFGTFQTPTSPAAPEGANRGEPSSPESAAVGRLTKNMERLRGAIAEHEMGVHTPAKVLRATAG